MEKYYIKSSRFEGKEVSGPNKEYVSYNYLLSFNRSLEHTGKFKAIEEALDNYEKTKWQKLWIAIKNIFR